MCPDRQIISLYIDGELPSPWKEKLEAHLASCVECRKQLAQYQNLSSILKDDSREEVPAEIQNRVLNNIISAKAEKTGFSPFKYRSGIWERKISLPLPAAAAAAMIFLIVAFFAVQGIQSPNMTDSLIAAGNSEENFIAGSIGSEMADMIPLADMTDVLQYLSSRDNINAVIIHLPETRNFSSHGEPAFLRSVDYSRSRPPR